MLLLLHHYLIFTVPVSSVTLTPTIIEVFAGQQMNLTCTTSYCLPPATITWHMSSTDNINSSMNMSNSLNGLRKTNSYLQKSVNKSDNGKSVYCTASNIPGQSAKSLVHEVVAWCKLILQSLLFLWNRNFELNKQLQLFTVTI